MKYDYPAFHVELFDEPTEIDTEAEKAYAYDVAHTIQKTLSSFGISASVTEIAMGSRITRYTLSANNGTTFNKIKARLADLQVALGNVTLSAPTEGIVLEVPNRQVRTVSTLKAPFEKRLLQFALGEGSKGMMVCDLAKMPHLLIGGTTGSGKSVCVNTIITNIIARSNPSVVKFILIDPKQVELSAYEGIPHLLCPVITDPREASRELQEVCKIMDDRYDTLAKEGYRDIEEYNKDKFRMPYIVVVIDELADLMMTSRASVEESIVRIAQKARACGIHLVVATQEPTVKVVTGLIKANMPSRIAFKTATSKESVVILGHGGAEKLLGKGDMIFQDGNSCEPVRVQGTYTSDAETKRIVDFIKAQGLEVPQAKPQQEVEPLWFERPKKHKKHSDFWAVAGLLASAHLFKKSKKKKDKLFGIF